MVVYALRRNVTRQIVDTYIRDGMTVGLGTGNTANYAIERIGERVSSEGLDVICVSTSSKSTDYAKELGIKVGDMFSVKKIDVTIDGADEIDPERNLIKGMGGALTREKIVASKTDLEIIVADDIKKVNILGTKYPLPVEVELRDHERTAQELRALGCDPVLRMNDDSIFITDNGNCIYDCRFEKISDPALMEKRVNGIEGVIENGLFIGLADLVYVTWTDGRTVELCDSNGWKKIQQ